MTELLPSPLPELAPQPPHMIGPTWRKTVTGDWYLPERTLGWGILNWWASYVRTPGGDDAGSAFLPTLEQARFILWWYAVDATGRYSHRNGVFRRMKGHGKDPLAAAISLAELCGPVAFDRFDASGEPIGKPRHAAWIQIVAVSQEQTKNTMSLFPVMVAAALKQDYSLEVHKTIIYSAAGGRIEAVTSSPYAMEGNRPTLVIRNETQWWHETNDGHDLAGVIEGNVTKIPGSRTLSICNAHIPGEDSVAERDYEAWQAVVSGQAVDVGTLYDALEAPADTPVSEIPSAREDPEGYEAGLLQLRAGIEIARGDSIWLPVDAIIESVLDVKNPVTESRRKFLNQVNAHEDSWIAPYEWDACSTPATLEKGDRITLGFDGSKSNDWTALVACRVEDGMLFLIKAWNPDKYLNEEVPREDVDATVRSCFDRFDVVAFRADVKEFEAYVDQWGRDFKKRIKVNASPNNPIAFDMRGQQKRFALDCERFLDAVLERELSQDGDPTLRQHVLNARRHPTNYDAISIRKQSKDSSKKIDAAVCGVLAFGARQDFLMSKRNRSRKAMVIQ